MISVVVGLRYTNLLELDVWKEAWVQTSQHDEKVRRMIDTG
jgi:hypothetical protein